MRLIATAPLAVVAALFAVGCARDEQRPGLDAVEGLTKLAFREVERVPRELATELVTRVPIPERLAPWRVDPGTGTLDSEGAEGAESARERRLGLRGETCALFIPGPFDPRTFESVAFELTNHAPLHVAVYARRAAGASFASRLARVERGGRRRVVLELPRLRREVEPIDELVLDVRGKGLAVLHGGIELVHRPVELCFAPLDEANARVAIGADSRAGFALTAGRAASARADVPANGVLRFSYGLPLPLRFPGPGARLRLSVRDAAGNELEREYLAEADFATPRWRFERVPLHELAGREVELRFELDAPAEAELAVAIADAALHAPRVFAPSVLLVTSDTHRADHLGAARSQVEIRTPALDALAARGVLFEDCYSTTNVTNPSHVALMTATHPRDTGITDNHTQLVAGARTLAECFSAAGFATFASVSAQHLDDAVSGLGQGFDRMHAPDFESGASEAIDALERWLEDVPDAPVFCWLHLFDAHSPYAPPERFGALYYPPERDPFDAALPDAGPPAHVLPKRLHGLRDARWPEAMYRGEISYLDAELARLFDAPRFRSGVIAVTADHGESLGAHGLYYMHAELYPDTLHVPLVLAYPGAPEGTRVSAPVQNADLGRTLLDLAGLELADFPGRSLIAEVGAEPASEPRYALSAQRISAAMSADGWFLVLHLVEHERGADTPGYALHQVELYDLERDPGCTDDRAEREPERARRMRAALIDWLGAARPLGWGRDGGADLELMARLAQLGYTGDAEDADASVPVDGSCDCAWCARFAE